MIRTPEIDDDVLPELPPLEEDLEGEERVGVEDAGAGDDELELGAAEEVGLDDRTGEADPLEPGALLGLDGEGEEGERWTEGNEAAGDAIGGELLQSGSGDEYGWTQDTEAPSSDWDADLVFGEEEPGFGDDAGEEGLDDEHEGLARHGDEDATGLPPLRSAADDEEELAADLDLAGDAEIEGLELSFEQEVRLSGARPPEALEPSRLRVAWAGPDDDGLVAVAEVSGHVCAGGERLYRLEGEALSALGARGLEAHDLTSVAFLEASGAELVVGTRLGGAFGSRDGGAAFEARNGWRHDGSAPHSVAFVVAVEEGPAAPRLWGRTRSGALYRSEDLGRRWSSPLLPAPVAALCARQGGGVVAVCVPRLGPAQLASSSDGGHRWTVREVPGLEARGLDSEVFVAALGEVVAVSCATDPGGPLLSRDGGATFARLPELPGAGALLLVGGADPGGGAGRDGGQGGEGGVHAVVLYAALFFDGIDRGLLVRAPIGGRPRTVLDVLAERERRRIERRGDPEGDNRIAALAVAGGGPDEAVWAATGAGLFRVTVSAQGPEGEAGGGGP